MSVDFDALIPRRGSNSYKWDSTPEGVLPMWVADMDFRTAPAVVEALQRRVAHGIFGYTKVPPAYYQAVVDWFAKRHGWQIDPEWITYTTGVVPALSAIIKAFTTPGDRVLVQTPVYNCFFSSIRNNGCQVATNPLVHQGAGYRIDFYGLEQQAADPRVKLLLLCNPHNPVGRVWSRSELSRIGEICLRHKVVVVSDEIHCEIVHPDHRYTPFASLCKEFEQRSITCISPSKAFNLAGLQIANIVAADAQIRAQINGAINANEVCEVNPFGIEALMAAYNHSEPWLGELNRYLCANYDLLKGYFEEHLPQLLVTPLEGTYLVWVDCRALGVPAQKLVEALRDKARLEVCAGTLYGAAGEGFIRINIASPRSVLLEGLNRLRSLL